jgi:hypothetical protein
LSEEISIIEETLMGSEKRNKVYMDQYETTYERVLTGAEEIIRRMKRTFYEKKEFCRIIMEDHPEYYLDYLELGQIKGKY